MFYVTGNNATIKLCCVARFNFGPAMSTDTSAD